MLEHYFHKIDGQVKFDEVDSFGVVHNIQYFRYLEWARIKYLEAVGFPVTADTFSKNNLLMVVHQEIDYLAPLRFFDEYSVFTKTEKVGTSSMTVENIICDINGTNIVKAKVVMVNIDEQTKLAAPIDQSIVKQIHEYENQQ